MFSHATLSVATSCVPEAVLGVWSIGTHSVPALMELTVRQGERK